MKKSRIERDALGELQVPENAYYGIQTLRASRNFPISGLTNHPALIQGMVTVKKACAQANRDSGRLGAEESEAIVQACDDILKGKLRDQFIVDVFQMGAGTSFHMNCNEVIANRAEEILGGQKGTYLRIHPNDQVNMSQSTNDVFPTAMRLAALSLLNSELYEPLDGFADSFFEKAREFDHVVKAGRTHLQDAAPIRLGQEFEAYGVCIKQCTASLRRAALNLLVLGIGGSAVGTGLNTAPGYANRAVSYLSQMTGFPFQIAEDMREAMQSMRPMTELSGALRNLALELNRIANDLRLLSSGPRAGLAEIRLPAVAPGSSAMPGKVNPSMLEMLNMVCYQVIGCDLAVASSAQAGQLELNVMMPVIAFNICFMIETLGHAVGAVRDKCLRGIQADETRCKAYAENSLGTVTALSPHIGYAMASDLAREALRTGQPLLQIVERKGLLSREKLGQILDPERMTRPED